MEPGWDGRLIGWYRRHQRVLPWRQNPSPYRVWVSEIMLQQTQVATVIPYFERFIAAFPDINSLAGADQEHVLKVWEGLGYYSRARNLHRAARRVVSDFDGAIPCTHEALLALPGVGEYTAAAIASIAYGQPFPVVDGNVLRFAARFRGITADIRTTHVKKATLQWLQPVIALHNPSDFNQALMELGALVCHPSSPMCAECPVADNCYALSNGCVNELPFKAARKNIPHYNVAVGIVFDGDRLLICKRAQDKMLGGLWEFPGGKQEPGEALEETARREIVEETGMEVRVGSRLVTVEHAYSHFSITMTAFICTKTNNHCVCETEAESRWVYPSDLEELPFPKANRRVIAALKEQLKK